MTEETSHDDDELLAIDPNEELANDASNTDADELFETSAEGEESQGKPEKPTAEKLRQKQIRAWRNKIEDGEATIEDLPPNQKWIAKYLDAEKAAPVSEDELDRRLEEKLVAREEQKQFQSMLDELNEMGLSNKKRTALNAEFKSLRADGVSRVKALEIAKKSVGVEVQARNGGVLPVVGSYAPRQQRDEDLTSEQRVARLKHYPPEKI